MIDKVDQERPFAIEAEYGFCYMVNMQPNIKAIKIQIEDLIHCGFLKREYLEEVFEPIYHYLPESA